MAAWGGSTLVMYGQLLRHNGLPGLISNRKIRQIRDFARLPCSHPTENPSPSRMTALLVRSGKVAICEIAVGIHFEWKSVARLTKATRALQRTPWLHSSAPTSLQGAVFKKTTISSYNLHFLK